jgi:hypothetical protein
MGLEMGLYGTRSTYLLLKNLDQQLYNNELIFWLQGHKLKVNDVVDSGAIMQQCSRLGYHTTILFLD